MTKKKRIVFIVFLLLILFSFPFSQNIIKQNIDTTQDVSKFKIDSPKISTKYNNNFANLTGHAWEVRKVKFSPNGQLLASGSHDGSVRLWNVTSGEVLHVLQGHFYDVISLAFSPDGTILASGGWDMKINLWNLTSGVLQETWTISPYIAMDLEFSPDGSSLVMGSGERLGDWTNPQQSIIKIFNITNGEVLKKFIGHNNAVSSVTFSIDGTILASGSWDNSVRLWNVTTGNLIHSFTNHTHIITSIALSPDNLILASGSFDRTIKIWNLSSRNLLANLSTTDNEVWSVAFSDNSSLIAAAIGQLSYWPHPSRYWEFFGAMQYASIQLWDITNKNLLDTLEGHDHIIESIAFSPDGSILASASWDWTIKLWGDYPHLNTEIEENTNDLLTSTPEAQGLDSKILDRVSLRWGRSLHSLLIMRHGRLVFEDYYADSNHIYTRDSKHVLFSVTKSFTSALIGIAINEGFIDSIDQSVLDFFPEYNFSNVNSRKERMTLEHLLTMTCGLYWSEVPDNDDLRRLAFSLDSVQFILDQRMSISPGNGFRYNSGASHLLSAIIQQITGNATLEFAQKYLFKPLGIKERDIDWMADSQGNAFGGVGLYLTPRSMAKFGQLYLNMGVWKGTQIIPQQWITSSTLDHIEGLPLYGYARPRDPLTGYGYQWWISDTLNSYLAEGYDGKIIFVQPTTSLVIVVTARAELTTLYPLINDILEAILPENNIPLLIFPILPIILIQLAFILYSVRKKVYREKN